MAEQTTTKTAKPAKEFYTILNAKTRTVFIQQPYTSLKAVSERLAHLKEKFKTQYELVAARIDEQGNFHEVTE